MADIRLKHTPGPWTVDEEASDDGTYYIQADAPPDSSCGKEAIAEIFAGPEGFPDDEFPALANARLIAAAPRLLEALKTTLRALEAHLDESCRDHNIKERGLLCPCQENEVAQARAAIEEAEGWR